MYTTIQINSHLQIYTPQGYKAIKLLKIETVASL